MAKINAKTTGGGGIETVGDASGVLELQSDGTTVINATTVSGNPRITGDFSNATQANRVAFQSSTANGNTVVATIPNGTAVVSAYNAFNNSDITNAGVAQLVSTSTEASLRAQITGTGTYLPITFQTSNIERMRIDSDGNVLMQTTTPTSTSNVGASFQPTINSRAILYLGTSTTSGNTLVSFRNPNGQVGSISVSGSATTYNTSSDYRLKEDVAPMTGALDKVALLKPVTYKWKVDGSDGQGFIAHELQEVVPECVSGEKDGVDAEGNPEYQGVDTSFLVATLTAAIQEQQAIITELKARIEVLEGASA
jgi:hypothetical protein